MECEACFGGYCRQLDQTRMVFLEYEQGSGELLSVDCAYPDCEFAAACPVAEQIRAALAGEEP